MKCKIIAFGRYELLNPFWGRDSAPALGIDESGEWEANNPYKTRQGELVGNEVIYKAGYNPVSPIDDNEWEKAKAKMIFKYPLNSIQQIELLQEVDPKEEDYTHKVIDSAFGPYHETDLTAYQTDLKHFKNRTAKVI